MDLYSRKVIGWAMSKHMKTSLVCDALSMALSNRNYPKDVIMHTDRGSQYCSKQYQRLLKQNQLICSIPSSGTEVSGKGNYYDNAVCESFFHTLKRNMFTDLIMKLESRQNALCFGISKLITTESVGILVLINRVR